MRRLGERREESQKRRVEKGKRSKGKIEVMQVELNFFIFPLRYASLYLHYSISAGNNKKFDTDTISSD